jgi:hypothetical protein
MTIRFKFDTFSSFDGRNVKEYKKGETYTAAHAQEKRMFEYYIYDGTAEIVATDNTSNAPKVIRPKSRKAHDFN